MESKSLEAGKGSSSKVKGGLYDILENISMRCVGFQPLVSSSPGCSPRQWSRPDILGTVMHRQVPRGAWLDQELQCNSPGKWRTIGRKKKATRVPTIASTGLIEARNVDASGLPCPEAENDYRYMFCNLFKLMTCREVRVRNPRRGGNELGTQPLSRDTGLSEGCCERVVHGIHRFQEANPLPSARVLRGTVGRLARARLSLIHI